MAGQRIFLGYEIYGQVRFNPLFKKPVGLARKFLYGECLVETESGAGKKTVSRPIFMVL
jgi:hypothetical protein